MSLSFFFYYSMNSQTCSSSWVYIRAVKDTGYMFFLQCLQLFIPYIRFLRILLILQKKNAPYVSNCFYVSHFWQYLKTLFAYKRHYNFNSILFATLKWSWNDVNCKRTVYKIYLGRNIFHVNSSCSNLSLNDSYQMIKGKWSKMTKYRR